MVANLLVEIWSGKNVEEQGEKETLEDERVVQVKTRLWRVHTIYVLDKKEKRK